MSTRIGRIAIGAMMATTALVALGIPTAQATTFDFGNVYFINNLNSFNSIFGCPTCMGAAFTASGLYQEINTTTKTIANVGSGAGGTTLLTEYAQNSSPSAQLVFTNFGPNPSAKFPNAPLSSPTVQAVQTMSLTNTNFQYNVGGSATQFDLNSIGLANFPNSSTSRYPRVPQRGTSSRPDGDHPWPVRRWDWFATNYCQCGYFHAYSAWIRGRR
jgi:hypothetical protein